MSNPTFDSEALCGRGAVDIPGTPAARVYIESMPGVDGQFVQIHGRGGRRIAVRGELTASDATPAAAHVALKALIRQRQELVGTIAPYVGTDGHTYDDCVLMSYRPGPARITGSGGSYTAVVPVHAEIHQASP